MKISETSPADGVLLDGGPGKIVTGTAAKRSTETASVVKIIGGKLG